MAYIGKKQVSDIMVEHWEQLKKGQSVTKDMVITTGAVIKIRKQLEASTAEVSLLRRLNLIEQDEASSYVNQCQLCISKLALVEKYRRKYQV